MALLAQLPLLVEAEQRHCPLYPLDEAGARAQRDDGIVAGKVARGSSTTARLVLLVAPHHLVGYS